METGLIFPQTEMGEDAGALRAFGEATEALGFSHFVMYDHILGADPKVHSPWSGPFDIESKFHEPIVTMAFLAACTSLAFATSVIVAPQRQTALLAKQTAQLDLLTGGRLRLGLGVGWNRVEYRALAKDFDSRGQHLDCQVGLLRQLWSRRSVTATCGDEEIVAAGLNPMPLQQPIPIWFGATAAPGFRRAGRLGDGWFPYLDPGPKLDAAVEIVSTAAINAGRDPRSINMEGTFHWKGDAAELVATADQWRQANASHLAILLTKYGPQTADGHITAIEQISDALQLPTSTRDSAGAAPLVRPMSAY